MEIINFEEAMKDENFRALVLSNNLLNIALNGGIRFERKIVDGKAVNHAIIIGSFNKRR